MRPLGRMCLSSALILLLLVGNSKAINVSGSLSSGRWTIADSPVLVTGDLSLPAGQRLDIDAGVRVEFTGPYSFVVRGLLNASGERGSLIRFTNETSGVDSLKWKGLRFIEADRNCVLNFVRVENSWARGDWPTNCGGGVYIERCSPTITQCELANNIADGDGGAIYTWFSTSTIKNCAIYGNRAADFGGGVFTAYSSPHLVNCTVAFDTAGGWGGGVFAGSEANPVISNTIIDFNINELWGGDLTPGDAFTANFARAQSAHPEVSYSDVAMVPLTPYPGTGNISMDPEFVSAVLPYDLHLKTSSPCVDAGDPKNSAAAEPDRLVNRIDIGAYGGTVEATPSLPVISVTPSTLNWEEIRTNAVIPKEIRVTNRGHYKLYLRDFVFSSTAFFPDSTESDVGLIPSYLAAPIEPGEQVKFTVFCRPPAIGVYRETFRIVSTDTITPPPVVNLSANGIEPIGVMEDTLIFGRVQMGAPRDALLYVKNNGRSSLEVSFSGIQGDGFDITVVDETIAPGDSGEVRIIFEPTRPEVFEGTASFSTNETGHNLYLYLQGRGYGPKSVPADSARFMGYVYFRGDTATALLSVKNTGDELLSITGGRVTDPAVFSFVLPGGSVNIPPDSSGDVVARFHPNQANHNFEADLILTSNYPVSDTIKLSGRGMGEPGRYVFGHVSGVWTWGAGAQDFVVLDSVYVPANERLKIEAGARILFRPGAFLQADGEVRAVGRPDDSISFIPADPSGLDAARWKGVYLNHEDATKLSYCIIKGSKEGVRIKEASPNIQFCSIVSNGDSVTAAHNRLGGGFYIENSGAVINGCVISGNLAGKGGGLYIINAKPTVTNCIIKDNRAVDGAGMMMKFLAGGLFRSDIISGNRASGVGGGLMLEDRSAPRLVNCTIADNVGSGVEVQVRSLPTLISSIVWNNTSSVALSGGGNALITYSDVQGGFGSNLNIDPEFDPFGNAPYSLLSSSPLIDQGNSEASFRDYYFPPSHGTSRNDIGAYGGPLGGAWTVSDVSIALVQNSAYPRWLNVVVAGLETFTTAPACSLEAANGSIYPVALSRIDDYSYRGAFEATGEGTLFLTANAVFAGGRSLKVGRTFELHLVTTGGGGYFMVNGAGSLETPPGATTTDRVVMVASEVGAVKPVEDMTPVSAIFEVSGLELKAGSEARFRIVGKELNLNQDELERLALFTESPNDGWIKTPYAKDETGGFVVAGSGRYILALTDQPGNGSHAVQPVEHLLISAFPNPFNGAVNISFETPGFGAARLAIYNLNGQMMDEWHFPALSAGSKSVTWEAATRDGSPLPSGVYWAKIEAGGQTRAVKLLLVR